MKRKISDLFGPVEISSGSEKKVNVFQQKTSRFARTCLLPEELWLFTLKFLSRNEILYLSAVNTCFIYLSIKYVNRNQFEVPFNIDEYKHIDSIGTVFKFFRMHINDHDDLIDKSYLPLFNALRKCDQEYAIGFLQSRLELIYAGKSKESIIDMVFFQKAQGETPAILANRLGLQNFLDYCFLKLVSNEQLISRPYYSRFIKIERLEHILVYLNFEMRTSALWMYALADICKMEAVCKLIANKPHWKKKWLSIPHPAHNGRGFEEAPFGSFSLCTISALLGSLSLAKYVLDDRRDMIGGEQAAQLHRVSAFPANSLYYNNRDVVISPLGLAGWSRNKELFDFLSYETGQVGLGLAEPHRSFNYMHLLAFAFVKKNIPQLKFLLEDAGDGGEGCLMEEVFTSPLAIHPQYLGAGCSLKFNKPYNLLDLVLASGWKEGISIIFEFIANKLPLVLDEHSVQLGLGYILRKGSYEVLEVLLEYKVSLTDRIYDPLHREMHFPLSLVATVDNMRKIIIEKIGLECAIMQLREEIAFPQRLPLSELRSLLHELLPAVETENSNLMNVFNF